MTHYFESEVKELLYKMNDLIDSFDMIKANNKGEQLNIKIPSDLKFEFLKIIDKVTFNMMEESGNFYGYFLFQMNRDIRFDISSPTGIVFKGAKYVIYFNPIIFLQLDIKQMEDTIKHEIHHVISNHLVRAKELKKKYSTLAINLAMDVVVNQYLKYLPPYAITLEWVNLKYSLKLEPYNTLEYYVEKIQNELDLLDDSEDGEFDDSRVNNEDELLTEINKEDKNNEDFDMDFNPEKSHDIWNESENLDEKTIQEFTEKFVSNSLKGEIPVYLESMIDSLKSSKEEVPWNLLLKRLMGTIESNKKKTITRRSRRQPSRLDLRGEIRNHKAKVAVAIDISGSISDEEFKQAIKEVLSIVKNYNHEITIIECDKEIRRVYKVNSIKDIKDRVATGGGTKFTPVFEYANKSNINLLVFFTDGKGENKLEVIPRGYKTLWVISGMGEDISLDKPYGAVKKLSKLKVEDKILDMQDVRTDGYSMNNQEPII